MIITDAIVKVQRFSTPIKLIGVIFVMVHCITADIRFNPIWVLVYVGVAFSIACVGASVEQMVRKFHPTKRAEPSTFSITDEERGCFGQLSGAEQNLRARPWMFLLFAGEDGFFFLPLLYIGITVPTVIAAAAFFAALHYRLKPQSTLVSTFVFSALNAWIVLPHGILPMILGHFILDAVAFGMVPTLRRWVKEEDNKKSMSSKTPEATPESAHKTIESAPQG